MSVLERSELDASPLADLHAIADQIGLDGFRRLRKAELIDAILERSGDGAPAAGGIARRRAPASRIAGGGRRGAIGWRAPARNMIGAEGAGEEDRDRSAAPAAGQRTSRRRAPERRTLGNAAPGRPRSRGAGHGEGQGGGAAKDRERGAERAPDPGRAGAPRRSGRSRTGGLGCRGAAWQRLRLPARLPTGALGGGPLHLRRPGPPLRTGLRGSRERPRAHPAPAPSATPPWRAWTPSTAPPRSRSRRGRRYEDLPVAYPSERLELGPQDPTLGAIEWLTRSAAARAR